ncbi:DNA repair protein RecO [Cecembia calidifontis]|jgi:DNA repair protein RecO (recombination protein O)|uniref:DNA repair protein RecO n=1 Tax=Cecembia calidifontis TaxID=1187080 RepID=A0A4Q7P7H3_9BACT|nr:DNA repair protein RecO [Cecembia calidifontis]RZS95767.1 DNA replication and repair protein RecO [Cecembia calidifontis]
MLVKTKGIVVSYIRYKESSIIVRIFTRELGLKAYIVNGVRSSNAKTKMGFYQPLTLLDLVVYNKENVGLNRISEVKLGRAYHKIPFDFLRSGIAMFMAEVLSRSVYEGYQNEDLFDFLVEALIVLDDEQAVLSHYPNVFLWGMARYLGFAPDVAAEFFEELREDFTKQMDWGPEMAYLDSLIVEDFAYADKISVQVRRNLLDHLLVFFSKHLDQPAEWKSVKVLRQMMA